MRHILAIPRQNLVWLLVPIWLVAGCGRDEVRIYEVAKDPPPAMAQQSPHGDMSSPHGAMSPHGMSPHASLPHLHFDLPEGWVAQPPAQMRAASFKIEGIGGMDADMAVIPLPGVTGQDVQIVNLWRDQLQLSPVTSDDLAGMAAKTMIGDEEARLFNLVSNDPLIQEREKARILVAMLERDGTSWFFKMTGPDSLVSNQQQAFESFLKSVTFATDTHGETAHGGMQTGMGMGMGMATATPSGSGRKLPDWSIPQDWKEVPPTDMLLAKYVVGPEGKSGAEVTISSFPGDVGGVEANVNRWRRQIGLQGVEGQELEKLLTSIDLAEGKATVVDMAGTSMDQGEPSRLVAATVPRGSETWFYKMLGPESLVAAQKDAFLDFVRSANYSNAD